MQSCDIGKLFQDELAIAFSEVLMERFKSHWGAQALFTQWQKYSAVILYLLQGKFEVLAMCVPIKIPDPTDNETSLATPALPTLLHQIFLLPPFTMFPRLLLQPNPPHPLHIVQHPLKSALSQCVTLSKLPGSSWSSSLVGGDQKGTQGWNIHHSFVRKICFKKQICNAPSDVYPSTHMCKNSKLYRFFSSETTNCCPLRSRRLTYGARRVWSTQ